MTGAHLKLVSPLQGWVGPLSEAPDPVFAEAMLGDGVAIDPTGSCLYAPCAGRVINAHRAGHAVSLRADNGAEILMHVGLETVTLEGQGFTVHVSDGQAVAAGDPLISFDIDFLAEHARSLLTPILITNGEAFAIHKRAANRPLKVGDFMMEITPVIEEGARGAGRDATTFSREIVLTLAHGLHARPAARISNQAKGFTGDLTLTVADRSADAKSPLALMTLGATKDSRITILGAGAGAEAAVADLARLIEHDLIAHEAEAAPAATVPPSAPSLSSFAVGKLIGVRAHPGLAIGPAVRLQRSRIEPTARAGPSADEAQALSAALATVEAKLESVSRGGPRAQRSIAAAHLALLGDCSLREEAFSAITRGESAGVAWRDAVEKQVERLGAVADPRIAERADDLIDLEDQVLRQITGEAESAPALPDGAILLARDLLPSQFMALGAAAIAGICTARGGPTSHMAILAAARNIPTVVAAGDGIMGIEDGTTLILDAGAGTLAVAPDATTLARAQAQLAASQAARRAARTAAREDCRTTDGRRIEVFANLGSLADAQIAVENAAEGCGLLRTEFLFLERDTAPGEDEQWAQYQAIAEALEGRPLIIRTLDIGADKPAAYLDLPAEDNPALGVRGVRVGLARPDLLRIQLRAILRVAPAGQCRIMVPMVSSVGELTAVRRILDEARRSLGLTHPVSLGVMIETPAAAMTADLLAAEADFLSIGTNDLSQYTLAMDRLNPTLAAQVDALHPAVLRLIAQTVGGARKHDRPVGVCGGLASDLAAVPILIGLGVTELSATPALAPELKVLIRTLDLERCADLAGRAMAHTSATDVRTLALGESDR